MDIEDLVPRSFDRADTTKEAIIKRVLMELLCTDPKLTTKDEIITFVRAKEREYHCRVPLTHLLFVYRSDPEFQTLHPPEGDHYQKFLSTKDSRESSGVSVYTVFTTGYPNGKRFDCAWNCYYCPDIKGHPRSYDPNEPGVMRAVQCDYDPVKQFRRRAETYVTNGLDPNKAEVLVLGGTWCSYPADYQEEFIRDIYYAANTLYKDRDRLDLDTEIKMNETATCRVIGLTLETRPDTISKKELIRFRRFGVTRVQLGVQHTNDDILRYVNRRHLLRHAKMAMQMLKDNGFKVDIHLMPDLPSSSVEMDTAMFEQVLYDPDLQADQWKVYPTSILRETKIKVWYDNENNNYDTVANPDNLPPEDNRRYKPYQETLLEEKIPIGKRMVPTTPLLQLLIKVLPQIHPWIRVNRVIRDFPSTVVYNKMYLPNARQILNNYFDKNGIKLWDIRSREIKKRAIDVADLIVVVRKYRSVGGSTEYFISVENKAQDYVCAFTRLYFPATENKICFDELHGAAYIRELHTYGKVASLTKKDGTSNSQHLGFGKKLLAVAEQIAAQANYQRLSVIAGVGVREYYRKLGYHDQTGFGNYQIKNLLGIEHHNLQMQEIAVINPKLIDKLDYAEYVISSVFN